MIDRGQVHQDHAVAVRGVAASLGLHAEPGFLAWLRMQTAHSAGAPPTVG